MNRKGILLMYVSMYYEYYERNLDFLKKYYCSLFGDNGFEEFMEKVRELSMEIEEKRTLRAQQLSGLGR